MPYILIIGISLIALVFSNFRYTKFSFHFIAMIFIYLASFRNETGTDWSEYYAIYNNSEYLQLKYFEPLYTYYVKLSDFLGFSFNTHLLFIYLPFYYSIYFFCIKIIEIDRQLPTFIFLSLVSILLWGAERQNIGQIFFFIALISYSTGKLKTSLISSVISSFWHIYFIPITTIFLIKLYQQNSLKIIYSLVFVLSILMVGYYDEIYQFIELKLKRYEFVNIQYSTLIKSLLLLLIAEYLRRVSKEFNDNLHHIVYLILLFFVIASLVFPAYMQRVAFLQSLVSVLILNNFFNTIRIKIGFLTLSNDLLFNLSLIMYLLYTWINSFEFFNSFFVPYKSIHL